MKPNEEKKIDLNNFKGYEIVIDDTVMPYKDAEEIMKLINHIPIYVTEPEYYIIQMLNNYSDSYMKSTYVIIDIGPNPTKRL